MSLECLVLLEEPFFLCGLRPASDSHSCCGTKVAHRVMTHFIQAKVCARLRATRSMLSVKSGERHGARGGPRAVLTSSLHFSVRLRL